MPRNPPIHSGNFDEKDAPGYGRYIIENVDEIMETIDQDHINCLWKIQWTELTSAILC